MAGFSDDAGKYCLLSSFYRICRNCEKNGLQAPAAEIIAASAPGPE
jgi:hypothetical protein